MHIIAEKERSKGNPERAKVNPKPVNGHNMFIFLYHFIWTIVFILCAPFVSLLKSARFRERLALKLPDIFPGSGNIWVHALSVGEVISALPLIDALKLEYPGTDIVFTVSTKKGMSVAGKELKGKVRAIITMPVDFRWSVRRVFRFIRPSVFILVETDIWPGLIDYLAGKGVKSILVNGRVSPGTFKSYNMAPFLTRIIFDKIDLCLMQSDLDRERLLHIGIDPEKVKTAGNIKFDRVQAPMSQEERLKWHNLLGLSDKNQVWVAGSTHPGEEEVMLRVFKKLRTDYPLLRLIIAPRRIEQSEQIVSLARNMGVKAALRSGFSDKKRGSEVIILDTLGELGRIYGLSRVSFAGGSLAPFGGHNLLEPAGFGCPVLFGPHTFNFVSMSDALLDAGGGWRVRDERELYYAVKTLIGNPEKRTEMGIHAKGFVEKNRGALRRVMSCIRTSLGDSGKAD